ncbi:hypothetical protein [Hufsiella ginkgonis]|uniref:Universal stress protein n=1 Tax=Hufsiella ginkgonis TaxID=2695274 RepID=A0A7K1XWI7_9SPHI|nr:hypothetical protein [Hufsiella ginkgonis]MXV15341.1 hypothetical protein [Hufsiella ginkgonis]
MRTILIPTDFKVSALNCVPALCERFGEEEVVLIYLHMIKLSDSISELLMLSRRSRETEAISDDFFFRCRELKAAHPTLKGLRVEFFYGSTLRMFRNFLEANQVDYILDVNDCSISRLHPESADLLTLAKRSELPAISAARPQPVQQAGRQLPEPLASIVFEEA